MPSIIQRNRLRKSLLPFLLIIAFAAVSTVAAQSLPAKVEPDAPAKMRDGVTLHADIYRPAADGKFPVLLKRTPYNKMGSLQEVDFAYRAASHGYVVIIQDVRGRYTSEGEWYPFVHEIEDGYDTVEWAAALPYSDGRVGMWGGSYVGATQMLAAISHPPHLAGICPVVTASNYHDGWTYQGGAFEQWFNQSWTTGLSQDTLLRSIQRASNARLGENVLPLTDYPIYNLSTPGTINANLAALAPYFLDWLAHPSYDDYWKRISIEEHYPDIRVAALHIAAWYDIFLGGSLRNYESLRLHAGTEEARRGQQLLVTVGGHAGYGRKIGEVDYGAELLKFDEGEITLRWYDFLFKSVQNDFASGKPVKLFVMGRNQWRDESEWPPAGAKLTKYFLHSQGSANSIRGNGSLSTIAPGVEISDTFIYDPAKPVPTTGGPLCCDGEHLAPGPMDQRIPEGRNDVLIYSSATLDHDLEVTGLVRLEFFASSSAVDTDFTAKLVDVSPDGIAINLTEGILRAKYRDSQEAATMLEPAKVYALAIDLWSTSNVFRAGHQIRLEISSSNFPRFDRNLNTAGSTAASAAMVSATNTILHDSRHPSALILSVVP
ncbi:MAG: CocE/NonD family hydrolase [Candidatus Acidiferrum sp.]